MNSITRRKFLQQTSVTGLGLAALGTFSSYDIADPAMKFGLVYLPVGKRLGPGNFAF